MRTYSIVAPYEDLNLPLYSKWAVLAMSVQLINDIDSKEQAYEILRLLEKMDAEQIVNEVLRCVGLNVSQTPFSARQIQEAYQVYLREN